MHWQIRSENLCRSDIMVISSMSIIPISATAGAFFSRSFAMARVGCLTLAPKDRDGRRSEEHTSELQSLMRISYAVFCLKKKKKKERHNTQNTDTIKIESK